MVFQGLETKIEVTLKAGSKSLKSLPRSFWESILRLGALKIDNVITSPLCDSYLLTNSSLLVFPHKFVLSSLPSSRLASIFREFTKQLKLEDVDSFFFETKSDEYSEEIERCFYQDVEELSRLLPGKALRLGTQSGVQHYIFHLDRPASQFKSTDSVLEVFMTGMNSIARNQFLSSLQVSRKQILENVLFKQLFEAYDVQDQKTEGAGYFLNAFKGERYFTFRVSPGKQDNFVSFETNSYDSDITHLLASLNEMFLPQSTHVLSVSAYPHIQNKDFVESNRNIKFESTLNTGHKLHYFQSSCAVDLLPVSDIPVPAYSEAKQVSSSLAVEKALSSANDDIGIEMMVHVPLFVHPDPARVLIVGDQGVSLAREVFKHSSVIECCCLSENLMHADLLKDDSRFEHVNAQADSFLTNTEKQFDVILLATETFKSELVHVFKNVLAAGGVLILKAGSAHEENGYQVSMKGSLQEHFQNVFFYHFPKLGSGGGLSSLVFVSENFHPLDDFDREKALKSTGDLKYYNPEIHYASFIQPNFMKNKFKSIPKKEVENARDTPL